MNNKTTLSDKIFKILWNIFSVVVFVLSIISVMMNRFDMGAYYLLLYIIIRRKE
jgi:hypothetical protein